MTPPTKRRRDNSITEKIHDLEVATALHSQIISKLDSNLEKLQILVESINKLLVMHTSWSEEKIKSMDATTVRLESEFDKIVENHSTVVAPSTFGFSTFLTTLLNWRYIFYGIIFILGLMSGRIRLIENIFNN